MSEQSRKPPNHPPCWCESRDTTLRPRPPAPHARPVLSGLRLGGLTGGQRSLTGGTVKVL